MDPDLLDLPLGVKIYVKPKSKFVFCRGKLGEKVKEVKECRKALLFHGVPITHRVLVATSSTAGAAALQSGKAEQQREAPGSLEDREEALVSLLTGFWHCACMWPGPCLQQAAVFVLVPGQ